MVEAFNCGVNFFDTSPFYGDAKSETVGTQLEGRQQGGSGRWGQQSSSLAASAGLAPTYCRWSASFIQFVQHISVLGWEGAQILQLHSAP